MVFVPNFP